MGKANTYPPTGRQQMHKHMEYTEHIHHQGQGHVHLAVPEVTCLLASCAEVKREESRGAEPAERVWPCEFVGVASAHSSAGKACHSAWNPPITMLVTDHRACFSG